jgi:hypothetical protein
MDFFIVELPMTGQTPTHDASTPLPAHGVAQGTNGLSDMHGRFPIRTAQACLAKVWTVHSF